MGHWSELALCLAAPLIALVFLLLWLLVTVRQESRVSLRVKFLGLTLDVKSDPN